MKTASESGVSVPVWSADATLPRHPPLQQDVEADVCVVGAGMAGLSVAYALSRQGQSVVVLDDGPVAGGETGRTSAHLASALDDGFTELERLHGREGSRLAAQSHAAAIDSIERVVAEEKIECGFERLDGYLFVPPGERTDLLDDELEAAQRAGLAVERVPRVPWPDFDTGPALRFARQAQFHPLRYLDGLLRATLRAGGRIFNDTRAETFEGGRPCRVATRQGRVVTARAVVVATNTPVNDRLAIHTKQHAYRTYVIALPVPPEAVPRALFWDTADPYHYVRLHEVPAGGAPSRAETLLLVGGEDHRTGQQMDDTNRTARLEAWARERFPTAGEIRFEWSGQVMEPVDGLAFIGRNPGDDENVFIATGDSGQGMTHGTIAGLLITDLVLGRENPWAALYDPSRRSPRALPEFVRELAQATAPYARWVMPGDVGSVEEIPVGEGAVLRRGLQPVAVYRDPSGATVELSAVCPHLGCIVRWNGEEKTWDCPCHGSRFAANGRVLNGPAASDLTLKTPPDRDAGAGPL